MNVLIIGSGGREHALGWKAAQSENVETVFVAPGNAGTAVEANLKNVDIDILDFPAQIAFAKANNVGLTIIGPEAPLVEGVVDAFNEAGLKCFGPSKGAAQLEGSKAFTKDFLDRHEIPTAFYGNFTNEDEAIAYIKEKGAPIVVKADGLAAGKGVILAQTNDEAIEAVKDMLSGNKFGDAGARVVVEEMLIGEEASFIVMVDGDNVLALATSQDHKARDNGDLGPNTGGMGAYSPAPCVTPEMHTAIMDQVIWPTVNGMKAEGNTYTGFLYAGIMISPSGVPNVLEFNCRFGDPETQPIMSRLQSDLVELCIAACDKQLAGKTASWDPRAAIGVVMAAGGYPEAYEKGDVITGITEADAVADSKVFHAGTKLNEAGEITTNGGRVLCVTSLGENVTKAQAQAYKALDKVKWKDTYFRTDIGHRAISREK